MNRSNIIRLQVMICERQTSRKISTILASVPLYTNFLSNAIMKPQQDKNLSITLYVYKKHYLKRYRHFILMIIFITIPNIFIYLLYQQHNYAWIMFALCLLFLRSPILSSMKNLLIIQ